MDDEPVILVPIPALVALMLHLEQQKGSPLTEDEVLRARDNAACIAMPVSVAQEVAHKRGYDDIDPENVWAEWLAIRPTLIAGD